MWRLGQCPTDTTLQHEGRRRQGLAAAFKAGTTCVHNLRISAIALVTAPFSFCCVLRDDAPWRGVRRVLAEQVEANGRPLPLGGPGRCAVPSRRLVPLLRPGRPGARETAARRSRRRVQLTAGVDLVREASENELPRWSTLCRPLAEGPRGHRDQGCRKALSHPAATIRGEGGFHDG